jgi:PAS domain S-box-containing protein
MDSHLLDRDGTRRVGAVVLSASDHRQAHREKLARIVVDEMYQFVGLLDAHGCTLEINRAALEGAGLRLEDIRGKPFWEARWFQVSREITELQRSFVQRARQGEFIRCDLEIYGRAAGDETIVVDFSLLPVKDDNGQVVFLLAEGRNITEKKRAEAEIARKNTELQSLLDRVRQLDQLKSDLFANVSHELRTPLTLILGPAEQMLATGDNLDASQRRNLNIIQRNAATLLRHVNDLLDLARLDARKMELLYSRVDLAALVRDVAEQFEAVAPQRELSYAVSVPPALEAEVDVDKLERVLLNLLSNAFKFTPAGGRVRCALERTDDGRALLTVRDSGPGIAPAMRHTLFERFSQAQQGNAREFAGTGLGLAIAREFVELHHGTIGVTDAPGGGALFQVEIPLTAPAQAYVAGAPAAGAGARRKVSADGVVAELAPQDAGAAQEEAKEHDKASVLVVEDNAEMRQFVREALQGDYRVVTEADGAVALERAMREPPDLVVTDLMMPRLGGDRMVEALRAEPVLADVPVLVLSARADDALRARLLAESVQDYVTKPFSTHELRARVRNLVTMKQARDALRRELASQSKDLTQLTRHLIANQHALQESEHRWWAIYEHSPVGIALVESHGRIRTGNPAFRAMLGYTADELRACTLQRLTLVEDRAASEDRIGRLVTGDVREYHLQRRFQRKDGAIVWANTSVSLIPGTAKESPLLVVVAADITERKLAQEALTRAQNELAQVTRVSTLGELAASIAHEVNQPLAAIIANGQACRRWLEAQPPDEDEAKAAVQRIIRDGNRAAEVITRIRNFLRRGESLRTPVDLNAVIQDVLGLVRAEAQRHRVTLGQLPTRDLPPVLADRVQVQQVVLNLVMNAIEAMATANGGALHVSAQRTGSDQIRVDVRDTGTGIDPAMSNHLFDAFYTSKPGGMGMGLAITRSILEAHGGRLWFTPNNGPGVTFSFTLPVEAPATAS